MSPSVPVFFLIHVLSNTYPETMLYKEAEMVTYLFHLK